MAGVVVTRQDFLQDRQGRTFADVLNDPEQPFDAVLASSTTKNGSDVWRNPRLITTEPPLAGVVRELEMQPSIDEFLSSKHPQPHQTLATGRGSGGADDYGTPRVEEDRQEGVFGRSSQGGPRDGDTWGVP